MKGILLAHTIHKATTPKTSLVIAHGLLGSKKNWNSIAKALSNKLNIDVVPFDVRNHGDSPHVPGMDYLSLAKDAEFLVNHLGVPSPIVMGHSMGGKLAMCLALTKPSLVSKLIVVDVAPGKTRSVLSFLAYLEAMKSINLNVSEGSLAQVRRSVNKQLETAIPDIAVRQFVLANLESSAIKGFSWKVNLPALIRGLPDILTFPIFDTVYNGPTLFIGGANSNYITSSEEPEIKRLFPNSHIAKVSKAGHWVHADNPKEFMTVVSDFIGR